MFGGLFGGPYGGGNGTFEKVYRAMPVAFIDKQTAEYGDKIIMPPSALETLASLHIEYPMLFKLEGLHSGRLTHCGVLEFIAEEGVIYMPHWMMQNLLLQVGDTVRLRNVALPKGTYVKLQPVTSDFLDITNPKAVLERTLRSYSCLTVGDCFVVNYNNKNYEIEVREVKPARAEKAISIIETDCEVDFEAPKDYKEPVRQPPQQAVPAAGGGGLGGSASSSGLKAQGQQGGSGSGMAGGAGGAGPHGAEATPEPEEPRFVAFGGFARRLDGKAGTSSPTTAAGSSGPGGSSSGMAGGASGSGRPPATTLTSAPAAASATQKAGTFISFGPTGNRLADKLNREKAGAKPPPAPEPGPSQAEDKFKAFQGKGNSLK